MHLQANVSLPIAVNTSDKTLLFNRVVIIYCWHVQGGLVFVCGTADGIIKVSGRRHNCDDLKATILAVDPIKFVYRGRLVSQKIMYKIIIYKIIVIQLDIYRMIQYCNSILILWAIWTHLIATLWLFVDISWPLSNNTIIYVFVETQLEPCKSIKQISIILKVALSFKLF